jgi:hypothetical protein
VCGCGCGCVGGCVDVWVCLSVNDRECVCV